MTTSELQLGIYDQMYFCFGFNAIYLIGEQRPLNARKVQRREEGIFLGEDTGGVYLHRVGGCRRVFHRGGRMIEGKEYQ